MFSLDEYTCCNSLGSTVGAYTVLLVPEKQINDSNKNWHFKRYDHPRFIDTHAYYLRHTHMYDCCFPVRGCQWIPVVCCNYMNYIHRSAISPFLLPPTKFQRQKTGQIFPNFAKQQLSPHTSRRDDPTCKTRVW